MATLEEKRARLEAEFQKRKKRKKVVLSSFLALAIAGIAAIIIYNQAPPSPFDNHYDIGHTMDYKNKEVDMTTVKAQIADGKVKLPIADIAKAGITYSEYDPNFDVGNGQKGLAIMAFVTPNGRIVTTVSFCEPCYSRKFHIEGDQLVCNTCGTRWYLADLSGIGGGCVKYPPKELSYTVDKQSNQLVIDETLLKEWHPRDYDPATTMGASN